ncbi:MAG: hypothetical protein ACI845_004168, partial [Gammaproteobacteria bacterium]
KSSFSSVAMGFAHVLANLFGDRRLVFISGDS